ncbi:uncharacterized protein LOC125383550 [Haliotis rufescens]|uniref:uncharacterized protein LOC125383550 n=1 Tax=Haliotis rufescens TaxID=6454 RepID=UPI00201E8B0D|nr:uncharacterized protein LOC125383550 [Haliotis rufescens]
MRSFRFTTACRKDNMAKSKTTRASEKELMDGWALHMNFFYPCRRAQNILDFQDGIKQKYTKKTFIPLKVQPVGTEVWVKIDHGDYFPAGKIQGCHGDQLLLLNKWVSKNLVIIALQEGKQTLKACWV